MLYFSSILQLCIALCWPVYMMLIKKIWKSVVAPKQNVKSTKCKYVSDILYKDKLSCAVLQK